MLKTKLVILSYFRIHSLKEEKNQVKPKYSIQDINFNRNKEDTNAYSNVVEVELNNNIEEEEAEGNSSKYITLVTKTQSADHENKTVQIRSETIELNFAKLSSYQAY